MKIVLVIGFVLLAMVGSFFAGNYLSNQPDNADHTSAPELVAEARQSVPQPVLPPKPAGREVTIKERRTIQVPIVRTVQKLIDVGPVKTSIPEVITEMKDTVIEVPVTKLVDASPEEIQSWNSEVKKIQDNYEQQVQAKLRSISEQRARQKRNEIMQLSRDITKDMIVPLITALTGLIGAIAALRWGRKAETSS